MSIIYDALKKAQDPSLPPEQPLESKKNAPVNNLLNQEKQPAKTNLSLKPVLIAGLVITSLALAYLNYSRQNSKNQSKYFFPRSHKKVSAAKSIDAIINKSSPNRSYHFILEGIVASGGSYTALINGQICNLGDDIGNAQVEEITSNQVTLIGHKGNKITLRNK